MNKTWSIKNSPFDMLGVAFKRLFPDVEFTAFFEPNIRDDRDGLPVKGLTDFSDDGEITIFVNTDLSITDAIEIFAHELAHAGVGIEHDHDEVWGKAFDDLFEAYNAIGEELFEDNGGEHSTEVCSDHCKEKTCETKGRYTNKDGDGRYYIESANGKLESDIKGRTYGDAVDKLAEFENGAVESEKKAVRKALLTAASKFNGHSNYHGDMILCKLICMAEGKEVKIAEPLPYQSEEEIRKKMTAEIVEEYRKRVNRKMEKYTVFGREYVQRIMREAKKEMEG